MLNNQAEFKNKTHMGLSKRRVITGKIAEIVFFLCAVISIITTIKNKIIKSKLKISFAKFCALFFPLTSSEE